MSNHGPNDFSRRDLKVSTDQISEVLPDHFNEFYPNLIKLFEYYFEYLSSNSSPSTISSEFFKTRDITAMSESLVKYMQKELLLGIDYFQGISNSRGALKLNNWMYRSKGSRLSIEQFFRFFFGVTPEVVYTKNNVFVIGESNIGYESQKFITNDKLYQTFAILIKVPLGIRQWEEIYKMFVHPAGVYLGSEVAINSSVTLNVEAYSNVQLDSDESDQNVIGKASIIPEAVTEITGIF